MSLAEASRRLPARHGVLLALLAAVLYGASTPFVQRLGAGAGSFSTAALLYGGAAFFGASIRRPIEAEARVAPSDAKRLLLMALFGAAIGPTAFVWGLQRTSAADASLMLSLEAVFTALFARLWYRELLGRRAASALLLVTLGAMIVARGSAEGGATGMLGLFAITLATIAWSVDNALSRAVAGRDPGQLLMWKGILGAGATTSLAAVVGEPIPAWTAALGLLAVGATGYGLSLRFYLLAQRRIGAARTGSVFAFAPFVGAAAAFLMGERGGDVWLAIGALSMAAGLALHLGERHAHLHAHASLEHEHAHRHDDGHHLHPHTPMPDGSHSHRHRHPPLEHAHPHVPDEHHTHLH